MKRVIGFLVACAVASCVTFGASLAATSTRSAKPAPQHLSYAAHEAARLAAMRLLAPADEYFGPLKMSILGIRNETRDIGLRYAVNHDASKAAITMAEMTERCIRDWEHKYPRDGGVPHAIYALQRLYTQILTDEARAKAQATAKWLFADYPNSAQAKVLHRVIAVEHLPPIAQSTAQPNSPPASSTYTSEFGPSYPSRFASPAPATTIPPSQ